MDEDEITIEERDLSIKAGEKQSMVFASKVKAVNSEKGTVDVIMSDASIDRYREVIDPRAWKKGLANYKKHPVLLSSHNYHGLTNQIGKAETIKVNKDGQLEARMKYFVGKGNPEADWGFFLAEEGVAAYSVGFIPKGYVYNSEGDFEDLAKELGYSKKEAAQIRVIFTEVELLENSHVLVPANPAGLLKGMESEEVKNDTLLKSLYSEALDKIDSFKDFFATEGALSISKSFGEGHRDVETAGRVKRVKKEDKDKGAAEILAAIKALDKGEGKELTKEELLEETLVAKKEADLAELIVSLKELEGKDDTSEEVAAFWATAIEKGFTQAEVFTAVEKALESGGPASPDIEAKEAAGAGELVETDMTTADVEVKIEGEEKDLEEEESEPREPVHGTDDESLTKTTVDGELPTSWKETSSAMGALLGTTGDSDSDRKVEYDNLAKHYAELSKEVPAFKSYSSPEEILAEVKDPDTAVVIMKSLFGVTEEEDSPEVIAIKDATDSAVEKINAVVKSAIAEFSSLTLESTKTAAKVEAFGNELEAVKSLLTDLEENKIEVKEVEAVTKESMRDLLTGIKAATSKIGVKEMPSD